MLNINAIEYHLPENIITNQMLGKLNSTWDMELLEKWTGVSKRYYASDNQTALDLAFIASEKLLKREDSIMKTTIPFLIIFKVHNFKSDYLKNEKYIG